MVRVKDHLTWGEEIELHVDLVVLSVGMMPSPVKDIVNMLKIAPGSDRFLLEVHPKLRPVETAVPGVVLAGTAQGPMNIQESCAAAQAAAIKVGVLLTRGKVDLEPYIAQVDPERCKGTGECVRLCPQEDAIHLETFTKNGKTYEQAVITEANCNGCGVCVSACPNQAIDVQGWQLAEFDAMVDAITAETPVLEGNFMNITSKEEAKKQTQMLVELRRQQGEKVKRAQELLKEQQSVRKAIQRLLQNAPRSIPQLTAATTLAAHEVLWHIASMKKYGIVEEAGMDESGEYYLYRLVKESKT